MRSESSNDILGDPRVNDAFNADADADAGAGDYDRGAFELQTPLWQVGRDSDRDPGLPGLLQPRPDPDPGPADSRPIQLIIDVFGYFSSDSPHSLPEGKKCTARDRSPW
jgi:hypothetical protein